jgi:hypothetical protein
MPVTCPILSKTLVIADSAQLAAQASCALAQSGIYLPVIDGPRIMRPDRNAEVIRRSNAAVRARSDRIILAGISNETYDAIMRGFAQGLRGCIERITDEAEIQTNSSLHAPPLATSGLGFSRRYEHVAPLYFRTSLRRSSQWRQKQIILSSAKKEMTSRK